GSFGLLADEHVPDPHTVRVIALERALIGDPGDAVGSDVIDEQPVFLVLTGVGEIQAVHLHVAPGGGEDGIGSQPDHVSAQGHHHVPEYGVAAHRGAVTAGVHTACVPVLQRDDLQMRAVTDVDLHGLGQCHAAAVVQHHDRLAAGLGIDGDVLGRRAVIRTGHGHIGLATGHVFLGN